ncbi:MAG: flavin reductase family protein [Acidimicrobiia bacterium]|nr:flavin reductase family protein [Acidimicrobiia bacterium]
MIHDDHPFRDLPEDRDPVRQFRGRLAAPVTVITAGQPGNESALTVSSLMVAEGEPSSVIALIGTNTDLWEAIESTRRFVVHILGSSHRDDADAFAGIRPRPGGVFAGVAVEHSDWGPVLTDSANRAFCSLASSLELPFHHLVEGEIERVEVADLDDPAIYFRGGYRRLERN